MGPEISEGERHRRDTIEASCRTEQKAALVKDVTDSLVRVLGKKPEHIHVVIQEVAEEARGFEGLLTDLSAALEGRNIVERAIGEGGMATVYLAEDLVSFQGGRTGHPQRRHHATGRGVHDSFGGALAVEIPGTACCAP